MNLKISSIPGRYIGFFLIEHKSPGGRIKNKSAIMMTYQKSKANLAKFLGKNPKHTEWLKF